MNSVKALARPEILALQAYSSARSLAPGTGILLNANENPWPPADDQGLELNRYPDPQPQELKQSLADLYQIPDDHLLLTRGSDEGIDLLTRAFCRAGHDQVAICPPCFGMYEIAARIQGAAVLNFELDADRDFLPDWRALSTSGAKLVFLCSPNNPTASLLPKKEVLNLCRDLRDRAIVVVDEAYIEFADARSLTDQIAANDNLVILRTLSKAWALAGARLGVLIAQPGIVRLLRKIIAPYPLPKPTVARVSAALSASGRQRMLQQRDQLIQERQRMAMRLQDCPEVISVFPSAANFLLVRVDNAPALMRTAHAHGILLRDQSNQPGLAHCVRISIGAPEQNNALLELMENPA